MRKHATKTKLFDFIACCIGVAVLDPCVGSLVLMFNLHEILVK